jgi:hypothetical protein
MKITKLLTTLILACTFSANVFAAIKSAINPLSSSYNYSFTQSCTADGTTIFPAGFSQSFTTHQVGTYTFTPDTGSYNGTTGLQGVTAWLASPSIKALLLPALTTQLTSNPDPTAALGVNLTETPIEWGVMTQNATNGTLQTAYSGVPSLFNVPYKGYFVLTSVKFATPANNNNVATGYAFYLSSPGATSWGRINLYLNGTTTVRTPSFSFIQSQQNPVSIPNTPTIYYYDCLVSGSGTQ